MRFSHAVHTEWLGCDSCHPVPFKTKTGASTDERVKGALGTQTILGAWCGPMSPGSAYVLLHHWVGEVNGHSGACTDPRHHDLRHAVR